MYQDLNTVIPTALSDIVLRPAEAGDMILPYKEGTDYQFEYISKDDFQSGKSSDILTNEFGGNGSSSHSSKIIQVEDPVSGS